VKAPFYIGNGWRAFRGEAPSGGRISRRRIADEALPFKLRVSAAFGNRFRSCGWVHAEFFQASGGRAQRRRAKSCDFQRVCAERFVQTLLRV
jgi:hypothetical protein